MNEVDELKKTLDELYDLTWIPIPFNVSSIEKNDNCNLCELFQQLIDICKLNSIFQKYLIISNKY